MNYITQPYRNYTLTDLETTHPHPFSPQRSYYYYQRIVTDIEELWSQNHSGNNFSVNFTE